MIYDFVNCRSFKPWVNRTIQDVSAVVFVMNALMVSHSPSICITKFTVFKITTGKATIVAMPM